MTRILFTVDTELSPALHQRGVDARENLDIAVFGRVGGEEWGIEHQMTRLETHGLKGIFFVEALCAHALGLDVLKRIVDPILSRRHDVQLHIHTEWLAWIERDPVAGRRGDNIADFTEPEQRVLLELGVEALVRAGAPRPTAFRAGNYGADNATLRALANLGLRYDSSYNRPFLGTDCRIEAEGDLLVPTELDGVTEVPVTFFEDFPGHARPLQLCASSAREFDWCIGRCIDAARPTITVVSHSFELLNVRRTRANKLLVRRFDELCAIMQDARAPVVTFRDVDENALCSPARRSDALKSNPARTAARMAEQALGMLLYDRA